MILFGMNCYQIRKCGKLIKLKQFDKLNNTDRVEIPIKYQLKDSTIITLLIDFATKLISSSV